MLTIYNPIEPPITQLICLPQAPRIYITPNAMAYIQEFVNLSQTEVSWLGTISEIEEGYLIEKVSLIDQTVNGVTCEFAPDALSAFMTTFIKEHGIDEYNKVRFWGHSHVNMAVSPSAQDASQIMQWKEQDYYIMGIFNKKGEIYLAFYDFKNNTVYKRLPLMLYTNDSRGVGDNAKQLLQKHVKPLCSPVKVDGYPHYSTANPYPAYPTHFSADADADPQQIAIDINAYPDKDYQEYEVYDKLMNELSAYYTQLAVETGVIYASEATEFQADALDSCDVDEMLTEIIDMLKLKHGYTGKTTNEDEIILQLLLNNMITVSQIQNALYDITQYHIRSMQDYVALKQNDPRTAFRILSTAPNEPKKKGSNKKR